MTPLVRYKIVTGEAWIIKETPGAPRVLREGEDIYRADEVEQQFTAVTQEREAYARHVARADQLNVDLKQRLADMQQERDAEHGSLLAQIKANVQMGGELNNAQARVKYYEEVDEALRLELGVSECDSRPVSLYAIDLKARVTRLKQALTTLLRKYAPGCPDELKNQLREVQQAREALREEGEDGVPKV